VLPRVVAVVGATATGKTELGERLAQRLDAEVVCADSRQVYGELEIGTGKPTPAERAALPHHLFDALRLDQRASAGWYARTAAEACRAIAARGRLPILVGGSGLYLKALASGLSGAPPRVPELRVRLEAELAASGPEEMHRRLAERDPETAARLTPRDAQRITRALEVLEASGRPMSWWHAREPSPALEAGWRMFELDLEARALAERIERRTHEMFERGLVEETRGLTAAGLEPALGRLNAVGYDEALDLIAGRITRAEAERRTSARTRQLAKRQRTWFRHQVRAVRLDGAESAKRLTSEILEALERH